MHIAAIMDGNRRWAKKKAFPKFIGHKKGIEKLEQTLKWCLTHHVNIFTIYALSTENLKRDEKELNNLYDLILEFASKTKDFLKQDIRVKLMGGISEIREDAAEALFELEGATSNGQSLTFQICINYGGRDEIIRTCKKIQDNNIEINEENIQKHLDSPLEPDVIIRTGGHKRLSNFLMWQSAYSEFIFLDKYWPDFSETDLVNAIEFVKNEQRNFGG
ncbi:di-trans,poly-cis-decaprenylcistransferase [Candidatus Peregrinibacteria bacterium]|jgi:undecaprenyl diphosphate synthase|nr:di-trans,poly-cis-decaprenylcistransferase [Candidatus Peregrinibacteria bacterium]